MRACDHEIESMRAKGAKKQGSTQGQEGKSIRGQREKECKKIRGAYWLVKGSQFAKALL